MKWGVCAQTCPMVPIHGICLQDFPCVVDFWKGRIRLQLAPYWDGEGSRCTTKNSIEFGLQPAIGQRKHPEIPLVTTELRMQDDDIQVVKTHASILIESLKPYGITLKKSQALEVMANLENRTDWNRLRAKLKSFIQPQRSPRAEGTKPSAFVVPCQSDRDNTEILKTLFELEYAEGSTAPVLISVGGSGHIFEYGADTFFKKIPRVTITYDCAGIVEVRAPDLIPVKGLLVNLVSLTPGSRAGAGFALAQLLRCQRQHIRLAGAQVGTVLIDDLHQINDETELADAAHALRSYAADHIESFRRLVVTSDSEISKAVQNSAGMDFHWIISQIHGRPPSADPELTHWVADYRSTRKSDREWRSSSLGDASVVADISWWVWASRNFQRENGESRISGLPGKSLWFRDVKASLIK